jgi:putative toxin-antitoxin system antitoxin component (TIGR02293 family)
MASNLNILPKSDHFSRLQAIEKGLSPESLDVLRDKGLTFTEIAELVIPPRTLKRRKERGENLSLEETERLVRVDRVLTMADKVFGDHAKAMRWLRHPDERMGSRSAMTMLGTEAGARLVENKLGQIDEGMFS